MKLEWEGAEEDRLAAQRAATELAELQAAMIGDPITLANEFAEARVYKVHTRNGVRLVIESPKSGQWVSVDPLELESLTWQGPATFSALVGSPYQPLFGEEPA